MTDASVTLRGAFIAKSASTRRVTGWASVVTKNGVPVIDRQGDIMDMDNLRDTVEKFLDSERTGGYMHERLPDGKTRRIGKIVDSFIIDEAVAKALKMDTDQEGWIISIKVEDDVIWKKVENGEIAGFSISGYGVSVDA